MWLLALTAAPAWAGTWTAAGGPAFTGGELPDGHYSSIAPFVAANYGWRFLFVESWLGGSASLLRSDAGSGAQAAAPLQAEFGAGLGSRSVSAGFYLSAGLSGPGGGLYAQVSFPGGAGMERWGVEARTLSYDRANSAGLALLLRVQPSSGGSRKGKAKAEETPAADEVHHEDPYGVRL